MRLIVALAWLLSATQLVAGDTPPVYAQLQTPWKAPNILLEIG
jgi:hypothetical protein